MLAIGGNSASTGYNLTRSLRTRASATPWLNRTFSAGNQKTWTLSTWVKRGTLGSAQVLLSTGVLNTSDSIFANFGFNASDQLTFTAYTVAWRTTTQVFRDPSSWYHIVLAFDTTQATAVNRVKLYVNGLQVTAFASSTDPALNTDYAFNQAAAHYFGYPAYAFSYFDGYKAETYFINGQQLTPTSFGSFNATTGVWQPAAYTGTYGTNGFYLPFTDNSALTTASNVGIGKDFSGNGNYWTTNNISLTAGVTYDSMTDVCTLTSATASNFAVLNPLNLYGVSVGVGTLTNGNLQATSGATVNSNNAFPSTIAVSSGKWYYEATILQTRGVSNSIPTAIIGFYEVNTSSTAYSSNNVAFVAYISPTNSTIRKNGVDSGTLTSVVANDVIGVAFDLTNLTCNFYLNGSAIGSQVTGLTAANYNAMIVPVTGSSQTTIVAANFGQRPFTYTPPTGFLSLNTFNLPDSTIVKGNTVMDATLYTGTGSAQTITNAAAFKPDFLWGKLRNGADQNFLVNSVAGATKYLLSNTTQQETTDATTVVSLNSNGFTVGTSSNLNRSGGYNFVGWQWQAGQGTTSSNTSGSITSTVSVNASAGFSVVTYTAQASGTGTVGHGLGVAPSLILTKPRANSFGWTSYHSSLGNTQYIELNTTSAASTASTVWNNTSPTSTVFTLGSAFAGNGTYVAYCWTPIAGYSAFGSYTGNGSTDGSFVYTGFRPKWVLIKNTASVSSWYALDTVRNTYNVMDSVLVPNTSGAEVAITSIDCLSNGFKLRTTTTDINGSGTTYIYAAFAENPFKNSLAR